MAGPSQYRSGKHLDADPIVGAGLAHAIGARHRINSQGLFAFEVNGTPLHNSDVNWKQPASEWRQKDSNVLLLHLRVQLF